jgi:hypothetical protein
MSISSATSSPALSRPELTKAIQDIAAKAKKQLEETGSLAGFEADYKDATGDGTITLSISSIATSLYDKSANEGDSALAFKFDATNSQGDRFASGSGSSLTIGGEGDIDGFAQNLIGTTVMMEAQMQDGGSSGIAPASIDPGASETVSPSLESRLSTFQQRQEATNRLVSTLQDFLNGLRKSSSQDQVGSAQNKQNALKSLLVRLDVTI